MATTPEFLMAEYEQSAEMARLHGNYRFTALGFFLSLGSAMVAATYWLLFQAEAAAHPVGIGSALLGVLMSVLAIAIDRRTMDLYRRSHGHCIAIEREWRRTGSCGVPDGAFAALDIASSQLLGTHTRAIQTLYALWATSFVGLMFAYWLGAQAG